MTKAATKLDIRALERADAATLRQLWTGVKHTDPPKAFAVRLMRLALAWDVQASKEGKVENLAALEEFDAVLIPILAAFEIPFQRRQNGCAKPIIIAAENAPRQDQDLIGFVADAKRWARELLE